MATMLHLFFGFLFIAVCGAVGTVHRALESYHLVPLQETQGNTLRQKIVNIAHQEIGVQEATNNNDGPRVEEYLRYTDLGKGYAWCSAFVSWCYGQAGLPEPRSPWSPALFTNARTYFRSDGKRRPNTATMIRPADIFGIYGQSARRINHVGLVKNIQREYLITIEGNSNDRVESKRRHLSTIYALANWLGGEE